MALALDQGRLQDDQLAGLQLGRLAQRGGLVGVEDEAFLRQTKIPLAVRTMRQMKR